MDTKKYEIRRNLSMYSEKHFASQLIKKGFIPYYPFKDKGIDILATKDDEMYKYQLKARDLNKNYEEYWFFVKMKDLKKYLKEKNMFYVFCALLSNNDFDFFVLPINVVYDWFMEYLKTCKEGTKEDFLCIKPIDKHKYEIRPKRIKLDINKYKWG